MIDTGINCKKVYVEIKYLEGTTWIRFLDASEHGYDDSLRAPKSGSKGPVELCLSKLAHKSALSHNRDHDFNNL
jgi:hypothetical protein